MLAECSREISGDTKFKTHVLPFPPLETLPGECNIIQVTCCVMCVVHVLLIFKQKPLRVADICWDLESYQVRWVFKTALPEGIWPGQMQRWTASIKVILLWRRNTSLWVHSIKSQYVDFSRGHYFILLHNISSLEVLINGSKGQWNALMTSLHGNMPQGRLLALYERWPWASWWCRLTKDMQTCQRPCQQIRKYNNTEGGLLIVSLH